MKINFLLNFFVICLTNGKNISNVSKYRIPEYTNACGGERIVGGNVAAVGSIPFQVSLRVSRQGNLCGGSIVAPTHVLTAAHCLYLKSEPGTRKYRPKSLWVVAGSHNQYSENRETEQWLKVDWAYIHQNYKSSPSSLTNDVCILTTQGSFKYNKYVQPVKLERARSMHDYEMCQVSGFGYVDFKTKVSSPSLLYTCVNVLPNRQCSRKRDKLCAGTAGSDACLGDSGGPLICAETQVGIVSYGYGCAVPGVPGVYARVSEFTHFIDEGYLNVVNSSTFVYSLNKLFVSLLILHLF